MQATLCGLHKVTANILVVDFDQFDFEHEGRVGRDGTALLCTIGLIPGDVDFPFCTHLHVGQGGGEAGDDLVAGEVGGLPL